MTEFARTFRVSYPDGVPEDEVVHGVRFPDGRVVISLSGGGFDVADTFDGLEVPDDARVVWQDGGQP